MSGYLASNIAQNVQIPHGVRMMFKRTGTTNWLDLGDLSDVSVTPLAEFLEHFSNHDGRNALSKRILTNRGISIEATLNEVNADNMRLAFFGDAPATPSSPLNVYATVVVSATSVGQWDFTEVPDSIVSVKTTTGSDEYEVYTGLAGGGTTTTDLDFVKTSGQLLAAPSGSSGTGALTTSTADLHVTYTISFAANTLKEMRLLADTEASGMAQFQIRNMDGGLAQIIELTSVLVSPTGALTVPVDAVQQVPLTMTAQVVNGEFGKVYLANI